MKREKYNRSKASNNSKSLKRDIHNKKERGFNDKQKRCYESERTFVKERKTHKFSRNI